MGVNKPASSGQSTQEYALAQVPEAATADLRMAGEKLASIPEAVSMAEESAKRKYAPEALTKAPSGYLAGASPTL